MFVYAGVYPVVDANKPVAASSTKITFTELITARFIVGDSRRVTGAN
jgi:hypothetical protein